MRRGARNRRRSGFTLIEVMVSLGVMTVGGLALLALQQHVIRSNTHARELTVAMQIAQLWVERLKQDAATWNTAADPSGTPSVATVLGGTTYLKTITAPPAFQTITSLPAAVSNAFDRAGNDITTNPGVDYFYCVSMRLGWVYFGRAMRADIRVWWARDRDWVDDNAAGGNVITADFPGCADDNVRLNPPLGSKFNHYHVVYLPTVIRMVTVER